jgi:protein FLOWERING LOCUS T
MSPTASALVVVDLVEAEEVSLKVAYGDHAVHDGGTLNPDEAAFEPHAALVGAEADALYTLVCTDPDPPDPAAPIYKEWLHWLVTNIPGKEGDAKAGTVVTPYM